MKRTIEKHTLPYNHVQNPYYGEASYYWDPTGSSGQYLSFHKAYTQEILYTINFLKKWNLVSFFFLYYIAFHLPFSEKIFSENIFLAWSKIVNSHYQKIKISWWGKTARPSCIIGPGPIVKPKCRSLFNVKVKMQEWEEKPPTRKIKQNITEWK